MASVARSGERRHRDPRPAARACPGVDPRAVSRESSGQQRARPRPRAHRTGTRARRKRFGAGSTPLSTRPPPSVRRRFDSQMMRWQARLEAGWADRYIPWIAAAVLAVLYFTLAEARVRSLDA